MKLRTILEMPHVEYNNSVFGLVDFQMEKYGLPKENLEDLINHFHNNGVVGKSSLTDAWLVFNDSETRKATGEEINNLPHLPQDWEEFLLNMK